MRRDCETKPRTHGERKPYEKPRIVEEKKLEALAVVCGGLFDQKQYLGQYNGSGYCTSLFS